jgi:tripartite-type tricarboxylate transporter receptor subunit TctC
MIKARVLALAAGAFLALQGTAQAQGDWPNKPVRIIAPFAAGGSSDLVARQLSVHLSAHFKQQFIVENRPGAGGNIGVDAVAKAAPDGYTLGVATSGPLANNKWLYKPMPFDSEKDLTPIALVGEIPLVLAVHPSVKASNLKEFVALSKSTQGGLSIAVPGNGTIGHLAVEYLRIHAGANLRPIPYKGDTPALTDAIAGVVNGYSAPVTAARPHIDSGKLKGLAMTAKARFPGLPNVPTAAEQGIDLQATVWNAVVGPAGLSPALVASLNQEINKYVNSAEGREKLASMGLVPIVGTAAQLKELMSTESAKWKVVVETAKITMQ